jgi:hypothetical protein
VVRDSLSLLVTPEEISHLGIKDLAESAKVVVVCQSTNCEASLPAQFSFHLQLSWIGNTAPIDVIWAERA